MRREKERERGGTMAPLQRALVLFAQAADSVDSHQPEPVKIRSVQEIKGDEMRWEGERERR